MKIDTILSQIDLGVMALPEFQRGYVWNRDQVRGLMDSLYLKHPVGGLLVWVTKTDDDIIRGDGAPSPQGTVELLLDGQQRITSLYGVIRGHPPRFFDGNASAFTGLYFNLAEETFEFYAPLKMKGNPLWVSVTEVMQRPVGEIIQSLMQIPELLPSLTQYITRLTNLQTIRDRDLHIEQVTGDDKTIDVVVDIFNRVNSGGTKLSKGDLALARICAAWPEARDELKARLTKWRHAGYDFRLDWLLRCVTAVTTGEAYFSALANVSTPDFRDGLERTEKRLDKMLYAIAGRLGLDHGDVLGSPGPFPVLARYLDQRGGALPEPAELDKLLYWYIHAFLWGRYAGSTESVLAQDLHLIDDQQGALDRLIAQLRANRGDLRVHPDDFRTWSRGSRFYPLLYLLTRVHGARDLDSGLELKKQHLGHLMRLEVHHIFPKARLYKHGGYDRTQVNALANFMFLTQDTNLKISDQDPAVYLAHYQAKHPGVLESQWIPTNPELWRVENFDAFRAERRRLLADAANAFLDSLYRGLPAAQVLDLPEHELLFAAPAVTGGDEEAVRLQAVNAWVMHQGLPAGELYCELVHAAGPEPLAILDLAWPDGLQTGLSQPVALLLDEDAETEEIVNRAGYLFFTEIAAFQQYVESRILSVASPE
ncbi:MAG: DUF262 domain-containing protein [Thermomicrobiales bacterium]